MGHTSENQLSISATEITTQTWKDEANSSANTWNLWN